MTLRLNATYVFYTYMRFVCVTTFIYYRVIARHAFGCHITMYHFCLLVCVLQLVITLVTSGSPKDFAKPPPLPTEGMW